MAYRASTLVQGAPPRTRDLVDRSIRAALSAGEMQLAAQPVVPLVEGASPHSWAELLIRPSFHGFSLPAETVVDRAAELGLAKPLDLLILERGMAWLSTQPGLELCSINVSGQSVSDPAFLDEVLELIGRTGVHPERICLEVTETVPIGNFASARAFAAEIRAAGCRMALDDFGTGSSNMLMLVPMEMDFLKIDGRFIRHMPDREDHANLVSGVVAFAEKVGLRTVAECVETAGQADSLQNMGVDFIQGYYREGAPRLIECEDVRSNADDRHMGRGGAAGMSKGI